MTAGCVTASAHTIVCDGRRLSSCGRTIQGSGVVQGRTKLIDGAKGQRQCHCALCVMEQQHCDLELGKVNAAHFLLSHKSPGCLTCCLSSMPLGLALALELASLCLCVQSTANSHGGLIIGCASSIQAGTLRHAGPVDVPGLVPHNRHGPSVLPDRHSRSTLPRDAQRQCSACCRNKPIWYHSLHTYGLVTAAGGILDAAHCGALYSGCAS